MCAPCGDFVRCGRRTESVLKCEMVLVVSVLAACPGGNTVELVAEDSSGRPVIPVAALLMSTVGAPSWRKCQLLIPKIARFMVNTEKASQQIHREFEQQDDSEHTQEINQTKNLHRQQLSPQPP
jgi:hypothetical protein